MKHPIGHMIVIILSIIVCSLQAQPNWDSRQYERIAWFDSLYQSGLQLQQGFLKDQQNASSVRIDSWRFSGPFHSDEDVMYEQKFAPEKAEDVAWKKTLLVDSKVFQLPELEEPLVVYLRSTFEAGRALRLPFYFATSNAYKVWLNDLLIAGNEDNDEFAIDQDVIILPLQKGNNAILVKLVCFDNPPTMYFSLKPTAQLTKMMEARLHTLYHGISNDLQKRRMYWEVEDNIWDFQITDVLYERLAGNYLKSIPSYFNLYPYARLINENISSENDMRIIRDIYRLAKYDQQKAYISVNYSPDNKKWQDYNNTYMGYIKQATALLDACTKHDKEASVKWRDFYDKLEAFCERMPVRLPSTPLQPGSFGAYYTKLKYYPDWDKKWRVADHADVVVQFPDDTHKFVFWRGTNYIPHWVTEKGFWFNNEFNETWFSLGSAEPMSDKQCRYSHVRIIESNPARTIIHWRYALNDVSYEIAWPDKFTGWGDWSDEYYTIYPDAVGIRKVVLHTSHFKENPIKGTDEAGHEWQEGIVVYHAYTRPEEYLNIDAVHVANMQGESGKWSWEKPGQPTTPTPQGSNIVMMNMKSQYKPFIISQQGCRLSAYEGAQGGSHFRWRDHWPTTTTPEPGRDADGTQAAHGSFFHVLDIPYYAKETNQLTKIMLQGLTKTSVEGLVPLAQSWLHPPDLVLPAKNSEVIYEGYDLSERAYVLTIKNTKNLKNIEFALHADSGNPAINPVIIVNNWQAAKPQIKLNDTLLEKEKDYTTAVESDFEQSKLVLWFNKEVTALTRFLIQ